MSGHDIILGILGLVGGGGFASLIVALVRWRPEAGQITVTAATDVVVIQKGLIDRLEQKLEAVSKRQDELEAENRELHERLNTAEIDKQRLAEEKALLERRVAHLEDELESLRGPVLDEAGSIVERREREDP